MRTRCDANGVEYSEGDTVRVLWWGQHRHMGTFEAEITGFGTYPNHKALRLLKPEELMFPNKDTVAVMRPIKPDVVQMLGPVYTLAWHYWAAYLRQPGKTFEHEESA